MQNVGVSDPDAADCGLNNNGLTTEVTENTE